MNKMMKGFWTKAFCLIIALCFVSVVGAQEASWQVKKASARKVILDTDMVECFDDGIAMIVLDQSPETELLGVTVVAGNRSMPNGVSSGVRQLEIIGSKVPIYEGSRYGIRSSRAIPEVLSAELAITGPVGYAGYLRKAQYPEKNTGIDTDPMAKWQDVYKFYYGKDPTYKYVYGPTSPDPEGNTDAVDFIVNTVNKYPGEVTIAAIGPATNIARAIMKDPTLPSKVKEIVYMGGSFYLKGNSSAAAEFNRWADPDAAKISVRAQWGDKNSESYKIYGNQMISGLEANDNTHGMPQAIYDKVLETTYPGLRDLFLLKNKNKAPSNIWDVLAVGYIIDPTIVLSWNDSPIPADGTPQKMFGVYVDVNAEMTQDYGRSTAYTKDAGPIGSRKAAIQNFIDEDKFWSTIVYPALIDPSRGE